jgi:hypothetical protein
LARERRPRTSSIASTVAYISPPVASVSFKAPHIAEGHVQENDLFIQHMRLKNTLRIFGGEEPITHVSENFEGF